MCLNQVIVLKFGGSVLKSESDQFIAVQEIYRWYRQGYKVIAVVSALHGKTDSLFEKALKFEEASPYSIAKLVGGAERESSSLLGLALDQCGLPNQVLLETETNLKTCGDPLDAEPLGVDVDAVRRVLDESSIVVTPGFVGRDDQGRVNLLGRGGSDLTALFIAKAFQADRCRLIKDVDGLYESDPKKSAIVPRKFLSLTWQDALKLEESILQHKAIRYALDHEIEFEVSCPLGADFTLVGRSEIEFARANRPSKLRVGLLGHGAVGSGVCDQLERLESRFEVTGIAVRDVEKHLADSGSRDAEFHSKFTNDWQQVIDSDCDVVVELIGGLDSAGIAVDAALKSGKAVVTANKSLLARNGSSLFSNDRVLCSAAVGGNVPMLEVVEQIARHSTIKSVKGILNGTTNFVLNQLSRGQTLAQAISLAQQLGLAENDPTRDLSGIDAAEKLVLLSRAIGFPIKFDEVEGQGVALDDLENESGPFRQVASLEIKANKAIAKVEVLDEVQLGEFGDENIYLQTKRHSNLLVIETNCGKRVVLEGLGAGKWPTAISVVANLVDLANGIASDSSNDLRVNLSEDWRRNSARHRRATPESNPSVCEPSPTCL